MNSKKESVIIALQESVVQRPAEETACSGQSQPSVMAAVGLRPRQLVLISEKVVGLRQRGMKPQRKDAGGRKSEQLPVVLSQNLRLSKVQ